MVGVTLLHRKGYFRQHLDTQGNQSESPWDWNPEECLEALRPRVSVTIEGRTVKIRAWLYSVTGVSGHKVPLYFLDTDLSKTPPRIVNSPTTYTVEISGTASPRKLFWA